MGESRLLSGLVLVIDSRRKGWSDPAGLEKELVIESYNEIMISLENAGYLR